MDKFREEIIGLLKKETKQDNILIEIPPNPEMGDYAFPCFPLAKVYKKSPNEIAFELAQKIKKSTSIKEIKATGPYLNFFINRDKLADDTLLEVLKKKGKYGSLSIGKGKKMLLEHTSINPNASPHVGRARNAFIGDSIKRILEFQDYRVETHYFVNDVGKQIAMLVLGAEGKKSITFGNLLDTYIKINEKVEQNPELEKEILALLSQLEKGDSKVKQKFKKIVGTCIAGQTKLFSELGIKYDKFDYESEFLWSKKTQETLRRLEKTGKLFIDGYNRWVLDQKGYGLGVEVPVLVLTRNDGTSLYPLRDITYAIEMVEKGNYIVVLGEDQKLYNEQVNCALKELELLQRHPVYYSFVLLKEGKMSTRKGNVVLLEDFMTEAVKKANSEIKKRHNKTNDRAAKTIGYGAIKFGILKVSPEKSVVFDWEQALSFEGETAPYIQYAYARIQSILSKHKKSINRNADEEHRPHLIANYAYVLAQELNEYYHMHQILKAEKKVMDARLLLITAVAQVIKNSLGLLGIDVMEKM
ncbi:arginine--tRNA ligase [Candidatus Woesearchaeota archaeon]|nr:arginine--tRNA ligase [Candidatus Woesearchaeota archaeon]